MRVVIFGATGGTGKHLVKQAQQAGHEVTVLARDVKKCAGFTQVTVVQGDSRNLADVAKAMVGQQGVLSSLGGDSLKQNNLLENSSRNIIAAMKTEGVRRIVVLGAAGALHNAQKYQKLPRKVLFWVFSRTFLRYPFLDSAAQERNIEASGLDYTVVHPPHLLNTPANGILREMPDGLPPGGQSISREEVAKFMVEILPDESYFGKGPYVSY